MPIQLLPADQVDFRRFTSVLNRAYADYYVPLNMTSDELRMSITQDDIHLGRSCVAVDGEQLVGLAMLAIRGDQGWIGGVGVIPHYRGQGIGRQIMTYILDQARDAHLRQVRLEVITINKRARRLYDSLNFQVSRTLHLVEGHPTVNTVPNGYSFARANVASALAYHHRFRVTPPAWQQALTTVEAMTIYLTAYTAKQGDDIHAYAVGIFRETGIRFIDLAHGPSQTDALRQLVMFLHHKYQRAQGGAVNIAENSRAWPVLDSLGYQPYLSQTELILTL